MSNRYREFVETIRRDPGDVAVKLRFEDFLNEPPDVEESEYARTDRRVLGELLRLEREMALSYADETTFNRLVDEYIAFRVREYYYFWDNRGCDFIRSLHRSYKVWLVSFSESRRFAVEQALRYRLGWINFNLDDLPAVIEPNTGAVRARDLKNDFVDFVRRYRGPGGNEAELRDDELVLKITPSSCDSV